MLKEQFAKVDVDESGTLDFDEICELAELTAEQQGSVAPNKQALEAALKTMDADGSGQVEFSEFRYVLFWSINRAACYHSTIPVYQSRGMYITLNRRSA